LAGAVELPRSVYDSGLAPTEQSIVDQFCHVSAVSSTAATSTTTPARTGTTLFFRSSANSCCGSVTVKSELADVGAPLLDGVCTDGREDRLQPEFFWNWEQLSFEAPSSCDDSFRGAESYADGLDDGRRAVCPPRSLDVVRPGAAAAAGFERLLAASELPTPVRCLLTPPESTTSSPAGDLDGDETVISMDEVGHHTFSFRFVREKKNRPADRNSTLKIRDAILTCAQTLT